ncbi:MAG TPA: hypothetical protein VGH54_02445 [Mycobacterium sp.]|jgi:hypothetical protein|uniref:hypothetical protein n=1 Tax=Mycobacterium sp. TaxID=1785 RepID=UPI002F40D667
MPTTKELYMLVVYVGNHDEVEIDGVAELAYPGEPIEVPAAIAGKAPSGERWTEGYDPGFGLLAQIENWQRPAPKQAAPKKSAAAKQTEPTKDAAKSADAEESK